ncbi:nickel pincer cofactor biosynthesis protein LarB [uncultured Bacteroides sp.]|uniref:nickel pincer cofactor biosynthesis protein LarB n=1 Tax=uncultured Bacteroides sp. TaxID=162156 RepID=UPI002AA7A682|nr:nickel pincer cofactor biosynthesis protein LarB [uncultured Bacteroides sp.]
MDIMNLLEKVKDGNLAVEDAAEQLKSFPFDDLGYAVIDHHRQLRNGCPEVIYCAGKTVEQVEGIVKNMLEIGHSNVLATRANDTIAEAILRMCPDAEWNSLARTVVIKRNPVAITGGGKILVITGGTSDIPVADEALVTAEFLGNEVERMFDVGVAGIHRLLSKLDIIRSANVIIVIAGMEGALASVVGGLTDKPVVAVPTSVGYGASFGGVSALLSMLNSCANGVSVVNIDNGFGAAYIANSMNKLNLSK